MLHRFTQERCTGRTCVIYQGGSLIQRVFARSFGIRHVLHTLHTVDKISVAPKSALVVLSRMRSVPRTLRTLGCFYRSTPRCRVTITNSLLKVSLRDGISCPINGIGALGICPVGFRRFLLTGKRVRTCGLLASHSFDIVGLLRSGFISLLQRCCCIKNVPRIMGGCIRAKTLRRMHHLRGRVLCNCSHSFSARTRGRRIPHVQVM